jgi:hypothetical protein
LVFEVGAPLWHLLDYLVDEVDKSQRAPVNIKFVVVEWHARVFGGDGAGVAHKSIDSV